VFVSEPIDDNTKATETVPTLAYEGYDSITFTCYTQVNSQYHYSYNPGE
jgi:hypothetical protein